MAIDDGYIDSDNLARLASANHGTLENMAKSTGFDYIAYSLHLPFPISNPRCYMVSNYPSAWKEIYKTARYQDIDITLAHGKRSSEPLIWSSDTFNSCINLWNDLRAHGLSNGVTFSCFDKTRAVGIINLIRRFGAITSEEVVERSVEFRAVALEIHKLLSGQLCPHILGAEASLTKREEEVLKWTADGKTSFEISVILSITERTVNFHIENATRKLDAKNKTSAAVIAAICGII